MKYAKIDFKSNYFDLFELADGIFAAISKKDSGSSVSAGFFDLGNIIIVFDTFLYPGSAYDLYKAIKELYHKDPSFIINSHYHSDHLFGNKIFPENIPIISTPITLEKIKEVCYDHLKHFRETADEEIIKRKEMLKSDNAPFSEMEIYNDLEFYDYIMDSNFNLRLPNFLINDELIINGTKSTVHLIPYNKAHTESDIIAYFPNEKIYFMADLLFSNLDDSWAPTKKGQFNAVDPLKVHKILKSLIEKDIELYIPGHGALSIEHAIQMNIEFINKYYIEVL